jgi:nucleotidyltransferase substrate binding protein (TIGR01987 family)
VLEKVSGMPMIGTFAVLHILARGVDASDASWHPYDMVIVLLDSLQRSLAMLVTAVDSYDSAVSGMPVNETQIDLLRTATIKNFEVAYEVAWKTMRRWMAVTGDAATIDQLTRRELFRQAAGLGLIEDPNAWFSFHDARNASAHTYREDVAESSFVAARSFMHAGHALLNALRRRSDA